jgi:hypothetical protein
MSSAELKRSLDLVEIKPGLRFSLATLKALLPDTETILFFGKVYDLDAYQLSDLLRQVLKSDLSEALFAEGQDHSNELQDYICDIVDVDDYEVSFGDAVTGQAVVPAGEILPQVWEQLEVTVAQSIKDVAAKLNDAVLNRLPGKQGSMVFGHMMKLNAKRPTLGDFRASVTHARQAENLVILDDSGSVNAGTVQRIIEDVVALSYQANAHFALVSNTCRYWEPGTYDVDTILSVGEYGGTHYEELAPLFEKDWGVVITIADYDSSPEAKGVLKQCTGRIDQVLDISLVNKPTFLAQCVGQLAADVQPLLIGSSYYVMS